MNKQDYDKSVSRRMRIALAASGMTMRQLSSKSNVPYSTVVNVMAGGHAPKLFTVARLCAALGVDANWMLGVGQGQARMVLRGGSSKPLDGSAITAIEIGRARFERVSRERDDTEWMNVE